MTGNVSGTEGVSTARGSQESACFIGSLKQAVKAEDSGAKDPVSFLMGRLLRRLQGQVAASVQEGMNASPAASLP